MSAAAGAIVLAGRILFTVLFIRSAYGHIRRQQASIGYARGVRFPFPYLAGWPSGVWLGVGSLSVALGVWPDLGALMIGAFVLPAALYFHNFWKVEEPSQRQVQAGNFFRNITLLGTSLALFGLFAAAGDAMRFTVVGPFFSLR